MRVAGVEAPTTVEQWVEDRVPSSVVHLDVAGSGRPSRAVLDTEVAHLHREAALGAYVAQARAQPELDEGRAALAGMVGLSGGDVAFTEGASSAFSTLLAAWPLGRGARIGTVPSEFGSNARVLARLARERGWQLVMLPVDDLGRISGVPDGLDLVTFPQVPSQRGVVQPVAEVFSSGIPLLLDVAQSLGQTPVQAGCAAYVGTSRKWLCGPRGVGFLVVDPVVQSALEPPPTLSGSNEAGMLRWQSSDAHVAGRVGLAAAVEQWTSALLPHVHRLAAHARGVLDGVAGWRVREPVDEPSGITTLIGEADPVATRAALLDEGFLTSAIPPSRSADLSGPLLRVSTGAWLEPSELDALARALAVRTK